MFDQVLNVLSFLGATGDYSYLDRLGNAIDEVSVLEALRDAIRAYYANCLDEQKCIEYDKEKKLGVKCLNLKSEEIEQEVSHMIARLSKLSRVDVIRLSRELALRAYAKVLEVRETMQCSTV